MNELRKLHEYAQNICTEDLRYVKLSQKIKQMYEIEQHNLHYYRSNEAKKTPIQDVIVFLNELNNKENEHPNLERILLQKWCETKLLDFEKSLIISVFDYVLDNVVFEKDGDGDVSIDLSAEEYYNRNFNHNVE